MPYFWESAKWQTRLKQCGIKIPPGSNHAFGMYSNEEGMKDIILTYMAGNLVNLPAQCFPNNQTARDVSSFLATQRDKFLAGEGFDQTKPIFLGPLFQMLNLDKGDSIVEKLLDTHGVGRVNLSPDIEQIQLGIDQFFKRLSNCMEQHHPWYAFTPKLIGSMADGCKVGYPDEFDFRLDLCAIENNNISTFITVNDDLDELENEINSGTLSVIADFYPTLQATLMSLDSQTDGEELQFLGHGLVEKGLLFLCFQWRQGMLVKVDCVPAIPMPGTWPSNQHIDPVGEKIVPDCHVILKYWDDVVVPTWSVCAAEEQFLQQLPPNVKDAYMLSKIICGPVIFQDAHIFLCAAVVYFYPDSYQLKNSLFHCIANKTIDLSNKDNNKFDAILDMTSQIFEHYFSARCCSYFLDRVLLDNQKAISGQTLVHRLLYELREQHNTREAHFVANIESPKWIVPLLGKVGQRVGPGLKDMLFAANLDQRERKRLEKRSCSSLSESINSVVNMFNRQFGRDTGSHTLSTTAEVALLFANELGEVASRFFNELGDSALHDVSSDMDSDISVD